MPLIAASSLVFMPWRWATTDSESPDWITYSWGAASGAFGSSGFGRGSAGFTSTGRAGGSIDGFSGAAGGGITGAGGGSTFG